MEEEKKTREEIDRLIAEELLAKVSSVSSSQMLAIGHINLFAFVNPYFGTNKLQNKLQEKEEEETKQKQREWEDTLKLIRAQTQAESDALVGSIKLSHDTLLLRPVSLKCKLMAFFVVPQHAH